MALGVRFIRSIFTGDPSFLILNQATCESDTTEVTMHACTLIDYRLSTRDTSSERILLSNNWDSSWEEKLTQTKDKELYCLAGVCVSVSV